MKKRTLPPAVRPRSSAPDSEDPDKLGWAMRTARAGWQRAKELLPSAIILLAILVAWQLATTVGRIPAYLLVAPTEVWQFLVAHPAFFAQQAATTVIEIVGGLLLGSVIGIVLAVVIVYSRTLSRALMPLIIGSQVVPKPAIAPLLVVWLGYGEVPKILIAAVIAFFPVVMNHAYGLNSMPNELFDLGRSLGASRWKLFLRIRFLYSLPALFSGLKIASTLAVIGAVIGEFVGATSGLGYQITTAEFRIDMPLLLASLVLLVAIGIVLYLIIALLEYVVIPWARAEKSQIGP